MTATPPMAPPPPPPPPPPPAPAAPAAAGPFCPTCRAQVPLGTRFCPNCGSSLTQPSATAPAAGSAPPVDIRQKVEADRGILKRLQLLIPGFRGYRQGEDLREADSILRLQVADKVHQSIQTIQDSRTNLSNAGQFQALTSLADALADLQKLEGEIRHAQQGYSEISPATRVRPDQLDQLYQYDFGFAQAADQLNQTLQPLRDVGGNPAMPGAMDAVNQVRGQVRQLDQAFRARMNAIQGIMVQ